MIYGGLTGKEVLSVFRTMQMPEPFLFPWRDAQTGQVLGLIAGNVVPGPPRRLEVDHMVVLPHAPRKLSVMMQMSEAATQAAFRDGCEYIAVTIFKNNPRASGLRAWAKKMRYQFWTSSEEAEWYVRQACHERTPNDGQEGRSTSGSQATPGCAGPER